MELHLLRSCFFFAVFWQLIMLPYRLYKIVVKSCQALDSVNFHEYITGLCRVLHVSWLAYRIEATRFLDADCHEAVVSRFLKSLHGKLMVDVGASLGRYSILLAENFRRVIAVEPSPENVVSLRCHLQVLGLRNVVVEECAVSNLNGYTQLYFGEHSGGHSIIGSGDSSRVVPVLRLDSLVREKADLVKVDVESAEFQVLDGAKECEVASWLIELHTPKLRKRLESWFQQHGYVWRWLDFNGVTGNHIYAWRN